VEAFLVTFSLFADLETNILGLQGHVDICL